LEGWWIVVQFFGEFLLFAKFFLPHIAEGSISRGWGVLNCCGGRRLVLALLSSRSRLNDLSHGHGKTRDLFDKARKSKITPDLLTIRAGSQRSQLGDGGAKRC
jgi:hypothetical protein